MKYLKKIYEEEKYSKAHEEFKLLRSTINNKLSLLGIILNVKVNQGENQHYYLNFSLPYNWFNPFSIESIIYNKGKDIDIITKVVNDNKLKYVDISFDEETDDYFRTHFRTHLLNPKNAEEAFKEVFKHLINSREFSEISVEYLKLNGDFNNNNPPIINKTITEQLIDAISGYKDIKEVLKQLENRYPTLYSQMKQYEPDSILNLEEMGGMGLLD